MNFGEMIDKAAAERGSAKKLAEELGISPQSLNDAKHNRRGLPIAICGQLAEIIGEEPWTVVCASELVTEKNERRRAYLAPFVLGAHRLATLIFGAGIACSMTLTTTDAAASDTLFVSTALKTPAVISSQGSTEQEYKLCEV